MQILNDESHDSSEILAEERGCFPFWPGSSWQQKGRKMRNACSTTVAPTGTISIIANCSGGIEPLFSLAFFRQVLDGQRLAEVHEAFLRVAKERGFYSDDLAARIVGRRLDPRLRGDPRGGAPGLRLRPRRHSRMAHAHASGLPEALRCQHFEDDQLPQRSVGRRRAQDLRDGDRPQREGGHGLSRRLPRPPADGAHDDQTPRLERIPTIDGRPRPRVSAVATAAPAPAETQTTLAPVRLPEIMPSLRVRQMTPFGNMHVKIAVEARIEREREVFAQLGKGATSPTPISRRSAG